jgi:hypothetical protein
VYPGECEKKFEDWCSAQPAIGMTMSDATVSIPSSEVDAWTR